RNREHLPTVQAAEKQFPTIARPDRDLAAPRRGLLPISELWIPLDVDLVLTGVVRAVRHPVAVWRDGRVCVASLASQQHVPVGRALDRHLPDRAPTRRRRLSKQELCAICRPAAGVEIDEVFAREELLVTAGATRRPPEQLRVARSLRPEDDAL